MVGALAGALAFRHRVRRVTGRASRGWTLIGAGTGALGGAAVVVAGVMLNTLLLFFNPLSPGAMLLVTLGITLFLGAEVAFGGRRRVRRP